MINDDKHTRDTSGAGRTRRELVIAAAKRGTAFGAAAGLLAGLLYLAFVSLEAVREIVIWRNFILAGAVCGAVLGTIIGLYRCRGSKGDGDPPGNVDL